MRLTRRMVKSFCESLCMKDNTSFPHLTRMNNGAIRVAIRVNMNELGEPKGMVLSAATSFWLPISPQDIFDYLIDDKKRAKVQTLNLYKACILLFDGKFFNFFIAKSSMLPRFVVGCSMLWKCRARDSTHDNR